MVDFRSPSRYDNICIHTDVPYIASNAYSYTNMVSFIYPNQVDLKQIFKYIVQVFAWLSWYLNTKKVFRYTINDFSALILATNFECKGTYFDNYTYI